VPAPKPKIRGDLAVEELDGEAVIYDEETQELHHLNATATIVFNLCDGTATASELAQEISTAFRVESSEVERHVRALLRDFRQKGLLQGRASKAKSRS
jgi:PqqD family protein of HPr-rel-A system